MVGLAAFSAFLVAFLAGAAAAAGFFVAFVVFLVSLAALERKKTCLRSTKLTIIQQPWIKMPPLQCQ